MAEKDVDDGHRPEPPVLEKDWLLKLIVLPLFEAVPLIWVARLGTIYYYAYFELPSVTGVPDESLTAPP